MTSAGGGAELRSAASRRDHYRMRTFSIRAAALAVLVLVAGCRSAALPPVDAPRPAPVLNTGHDVVAAMHERHAGHWFHTLTFRQKTSRLLTGGTWDVQTWYEALSLPGRLRIDFAPVSTGNGVLYARDSQFVVQNDRVVSAGPGINDLLLVGFDVYANAPARTEALLRGQGFDLSRVHSTTFEGRPVVVVGARAGETRRKQFWIDTERLVFVRLIQPLVRDTAKVQDIRFVSYEPRGESWIAKRVELYTGGALTLSEDYTDIRVDPVLDESLFAPDRWKTAKHWVTQP